MSAPTTLTFSQCRVTDLSGASAVQLYFGYADGWFLATTALPAAGSTVAWDGEFSETIVEDPRNRTTFVAVFDPQANAVLGFGQFELSVTSRPLVQPVAFTTESGVRFSGSLLIEPPAPREQGIVREVQVRAFVTDLVVDLEKHGERVKGTF